MELRVGTPGYQAPEVKSNSYITTAIDIWSIAVVINEMATG